MHTLQWNVRPRSRVTTARRYKTGLCEHSKVKKESKKKNTHINLLGTKIENLELELRCPLTTIPSKENSLRAGYTCLCCIINYLAK